jgi:hypothetical protein
LTWEVRGLSLLPEDLTGGIQARDNYFARVQIVLRERLKIEAKSKLKQAAQERGEGREETPGSRDRCGGAHGRACSSSIDDDPVGSEGALSVQLRRQVGPAARQWHHVRNPDR